MDVQDDIVYFGGDFGSVDGSTRNNAAAVRIAPGAPGDGELQGWNPNLGGPIYDLDAFGEVVYLAGGFGSVDGSSRPGILIGHWSSSPLLLSSKRLQAGGSAVPDGRGSWRGRRRRPCFEPPTWWRVAPMRSLNRCTVWVCLQIASW